MTWFINLATRTKLSLGFGLIVVLLLAVIASAYVTITAMRESQKRLYEREFANAVDLKDVRSNQNANRANITIMLMLGKRSDQASAPLIQDITSRSRENSETIKRLIERNRSDPKFSSRLEQFNAIRTAYHDTQEAQTIPLVTEGKLEEAKKLVLGSQDERNRKMREIADELVDEAERAGQAAVTQSAQQAENAIRVFVILGVIALLGSAGMATLLNRVIASPLKEISDVAERVAAGDLTVNLPASNRADEVGALLQMFRKMVENLRQVTHEIREGANVLASSASEIVATTTQVASGGAETAAAGDGTTAT